MIDTNINQGLPIYASETPTEIRGKKEYQANKGDIE